MSPIFKKLIFYWRIIALQNFTVFCQISTWISHRYTYISSLLKLPPISLSIPPLWVDTELLFDFLEPYSKCLLAIYFTYDNVSFHVTLSIHLTLPPLSPYSQVYSLCLILHCCPVNKFFSTIFLDSVCMC